MAIGKARLSLRLYAGFGLIILLLAVVGALGWRSLEQVGEMSVRAADANLVVQHMLEARRQEKNFVIRREATYAEQVDQLISAMLSHAAKARIRVDSAEDLKCWDQVTLQVRNYQEAFTRYREQALAAGGVSAKALTQWDEGMVQSAREAIAQCRRLAYAQQRHMNDLMSEVQALILGVSGAALVLGLVFAWLLTRSVNKPLVGVINGLNQGSLQVAAAAAQVSSASQSLAQGTSRQAASLEETAASMEEMVAMTKRNAQSAGQAETLVEQSRRTLDQAHQSMRELLEAMAGITANSDQTVKIIKTIDEIAFQTNLLALNAAVEAARAGEVGAGFAVVADEVRNLALRAAEAAKSTGELLESSIVQIKQGSDLVTRSEAQFREVREVSLRIGEHISQIAEASGEQSLGIEQINQNTGQMDAVNQEVAAQAEQTAAASEELNGQANSMRDYVLSLDRIITGGSGNHNGSDEQSFAYADRRMLLPPA